MPNVARSMSRVPGPRPTAVTAMSNSSAYRGLSSMNSWLNSETTSEATASLTIRNGHDVPIAAVRPADWRDSVASMMNALAGCFG